MPGPWEIALILLVVLVIFGSKKLKTLGSDLGDAIKGFRNSMGMEKATESAETEPEASQTDSVETSAPKAKAAE